MLLAAFLLSKDYDMPDSNTIVTQARTWIGTPFHHQARLKGKGCDCLGLIVGVVDELGLKD